MSNLVVTNAGEIALLDQLQRDQATNAENYLLHLYKNNYDPVATSAIGDFSEADFTGATAKTLTRSSFTAATTVSNVAKTTYAQQTFTNSGSTQTVYGYYITGATNTTLVYWAQKFDDARTLASGDVVNITPAFTLGSAN